MPINCMAITMIVEPNFLIFRLEVKKNWWRAQFLLMLNYTRTYTERERDILHFSGVSSCIQMGEMCGTIESTQHFFEGVWCCNTATPLLALSIFHEDDAMKIVRESEKSFYNVSVPFNFLFPLITFTYILNCFS